MECPITNEEIVIPDRLKCGHVFEAISINEWLNTNTTCPICRADVKEDEDLVDILTAIFKNYGFNIIRIKIDSTYFVIEFKKIIYDASLTLLFLDQVMNLMINMNLMLHDISFGIRKSMTFKKMNI